MTEASDVTLGKLVVQVENLTKEITALRKGLSEQSDYHDESVSALKKVVDVYILFSEETKSGLIELKGTLKGGTAVLAFFQAAVFGAFFWLFAQTYSQQNEITQLKSYSQHVDIMLNNIQRRVP